MPRSAADVPTDSFDGVTAAGLCERLHVPAVHLYASTGSTLDVAHTLAAQGAPDGTVVLADAQTRGRGRGGKRWASAPGGGVWLTLIARPASAESVRVLTVRLGLVTAHALDAFAAAPIELKWPNDLHLGGGKLAGVLVEARWRGAALEWLAIGLGVNVTAPVDVPRAAGLRPGTKRVEVLEALVPVLVAAAKRPGGELDADELHAYAARDLAANRRASSPVHGLVRGINAAAELVVATSDGDVAIGSGSLVLSEDT